jgi:integrase
MTLLYGKIATREGFLQEIEKDKLIPKLEVELIKEFIGYRVRIGKLKSQSSNRVKHLYQLRKDRFPKDFLYMTEKDINKLVDDLGRAENRLGRPYSENTLKDFNVAIKSFYKWLRTEHGYPKDYPVKELAGTKLKKNSRDYPEEVAELPTNVSKNNYVKPSELLTEDEILKMIDIAEHPRDKAFISMLYESGCRIGEIASLKLKDVYIDKDDKDIMIIEVSGKTGQRDIPLHWCIPWVMTWKNTHPYKKNPEAYLWVNYGARAHNKPMSYNTFNMVLMHIGVKAGIKKKVNPHIFRKSIATSEAKLGTNSYMMNQKFGWTPSSKVANVYIRLAGKDLKRMVKHKFGLSDEDQVESKLKSVKCPRCATINSDLKTPCDKCGAPLTTKQGVVIQQEKKVIEKRLSDVEDVFKVLIDSNPRLKKSFNEYIKKTTKSEA